MLNSLRGGSILVVASMCVVGLPQCLAAQEHTLSIQERWETLGPKDEPFVNVNGMAESPTGEIWISDSGAVWLLDKNGEVLRRIGGSGEGPGEFLSPTRITTTAAGMMAVLDIVRSSIELFRPDGTFAKRILLEVQPFNVKGFVADADDTFLISGGIYSKAYAIHRFDGEGRWIEGFGDLPVPKVASPDNYENSLQVTGGPLAIGEDGRLFYSQAAPFEVVAYGEGSQAPRVVDQEVDLLAPIVDNFTTETIVDGVRHIRPRWFFDQSRGLNVIHGGLLNSITYEERGRTLWRYYDSDGNLQATKVSPDEYWVWGRTADGDLLASRWNLASDETSAVRLSVRFGSR